MHFEIIKEHSGLTRLLLNIFTSVLKESGCGWFTPRSRWVTLLSPCNCCVSIPWGLVYCVKCSLRSISMVSESTQRFDFLLLTLSYLRKMISSWLRFSNMSIHLNYFRNSGVHKILPWLYFVVIRHNSDNKSFDPYNTTYRIKIGTLFPLKFSRGLVPHR